MGVQWGSSGLGARRGGGRRVVARGSLVGGGSDVCRLGNRQSGDGKVRL